MLLTQCDDESKVVVVLSDDGDELVHMHTHRSENT